MNLDKSSEGFVSIAIVTEQLLKAILKIYFFLTFLKSIIHLAIRFAIPGVRFVFPLSEGSPAVGADKAFRVEFIS